MENCRCGEGNFAWRQFATFLSCHDSLPFEGQKLGLFLIKCCLAGISSGFPCLLKKTLLATSWAKQVSALRFLLLQPTWELQAQEGSSFGMNQTGGMVALLLWEESPPPAENPDLGVGLSL